VVQSKYLKGTKTTNKGNITTQTFPASPALLNRLEVPMKEQKEYLEARERLVRLKTEDTDIIYDTRLRPYQNIDVCFLSMFSKGIGIFNQQRTGKTPTTLVTMRIKKQVKNLIIVTLTGVYQWHREYIKWHGGPVAVVPQHGNIVKREQFYKDNKDKTLIINYDKIETDYELIKKYYKHFDAIVVDEAHHLRNFTGIRKRINKHGKEVTKSPKFTENTIRLRRISSDAYALTGTPALNKSENIYAILCFIFPDLFGGYQGFLDYYFLRTETRIGGNVYSKPDGIHPEKEKELLEFLELFSIQRKRKEVLPWLPPVDKETIILEPSEELLFHHNELSEFFETANISCQNGLSVMLAQRQLTINPRHFGLDIESQKFEWIKSFVAEDPKRPTLITGFFTKILDELSKEIKTRHRMMTGATSAKERDKIIQDFQNGTINLIIANVDVISENVTLSRAEVLIILDKSLTEGTNQQLEDRFLPITKEEAEKKETHKIIDFRIMGTIDEYIDNMLARKYCDVDIINDYVKHLKGGDKCDKTIKHEEKF